MITEEYKQLLRRYQAAWSAGDTDSLREMLHPECVNYQLVTGEARPLEFEIDACKTWHAAFSNVDIQIQQIVAEGNRVVVHWLLVSKHTNEFMGIAASRKIVKIPGMEINRIQDGRIAEIWRLSDTMSVMEQLGAV
jgi:steroid delta-isomerase-like uncharacterized protein